MWPLRGADQYVHIEGKIIMAEKLDEKQMVEFKELLMSEVIQSEALVNILDKKGIVSKQELLEEMRRVQAAMVKADGKY